MHCGTKERWYLTATTDQQQNSFCREGIKTVSREEETKYLCFTFYPIFDINREGWKLPFFISTK